MLTVPNVPVAFNNPAIQMVVGKERQFQFVVTERSTGAVIDVTSWLNFRFMAKIHAADLDGDAIISKSLTGGGIVKASPTQGVLQVTIAPADTSTLADIRQSFFAEIQGVDAASVPWPLWQGGLDILPTAILAST